MRRRNLLLGAAGVALGGAGSRAGPGGGAQANAWAFVPPDQSFAPSPATQALQRAAARVRSRVPHAMAQVHVEGTLPHQGIHDASREALRDLPAARDLALSGRLGTPADGPRAAALAGAWARTYQPSFNPIDETGFEALFLAWDLLAPELRAPFAGEMHALLRAFAEDSLARPLPGRATRVNNHNSHRLKIIVLARYALGCDMAPARTAFAAHLAANIGPDGETVDFRQRDALHYVAYDLEPLLMAALAARRHGEDWFSLADARLSRALEWLAPYADGSRRHEEFVRTTVRFDRARQAAGLPGFAGPFDPSQAGLTYALAARLDRRWAALGRAPAWLDVLAPL